MSCAKKTTEPIQMPFGLWARMGRRNHVLDAGRVQIPLWEGSNFEVEKAAHYNVYRRSVVSCAKMAEPIKMPFGLRIRAGPRNHVLDGVQIPFMGMGNFKGERGGPLYCKVQRLCRDRELCNKSSAVVETGDRGHNRHGPKTEAALPFSRGAGSPSNTMWPGPRSTSVLSAWRLHPSSRLATIDMDRKLGSCAPFMGSCDPHLTQRRLGRDLPPY